MQNGPPSPASLSIDDPQNISLPIKHLPQPEGFVSSKLHSRIISFPIISCYLCNSETLRTAFALFSIVSLMSSALMSFLSTLRVVVQNLNLQCIPSPFASHDVCA